MFRKLLMFCVLVQPGVVSILVMSRPFSKIRFIQNLAIHAAMALPLVMTTESEYTHENYC